MSNSPWAALFVPARPDKATITAFCDFLTVLAQEDLRLHPGVPDLYASGVYYQELPEIWAVPTWALYLREHGFGADCKTLAAWRVAELRERYGEPAARCWVSATAEPGKLLYHIQVQRSDGSIEDPSAKLGMHAALAAGQGAPAWNLLPFRL